MRSPGPAHLLTPCLLVGLLLLSGCGAATPEDSAALEPTAATTPTTPAPARQAPRVSADTTTLRKLAHGAHPRQITLRDGDVIFSLVDAEPKGHRVTTSSISLAQALKAAAEMSGGPSIPTTCKLGRLNDRETFKPLPHGARHYLYPDTPAWMCFQIGVMVMPSLGGVASRGHDVSFIDARTGALLFTIEDGG